MDRGDPYLYYGSKQSCFCGSLHCHFRGWLSLPFTPSKDGLQIIHPLDSTWNQKEKIFFLVCYVSVQRPVDSYMCFFLKQRASFQAGLFYTFFSLLFLFPYIFIHILIRTWITCWRNKNQIVWSEMYESLSSLTKKKKGFTPFCKTFLLLN